jgi:hypothetical protein
METLSDLLAAIERELGPACKRSAQQRRQLIRFHATAWHIQTVLHRESLDSIRIEELTGIDAKLAARLKQLRATRGCFARHRRSKDLLLETAHRLGWTSPSYDVVLQWKPVYSIRQFTQFSECREIIEYAIAEGILPEDYSNEHLAEWKRKKLKRGCSPTATDRAVCHLRYAIRRGGLAEQFPLLDVSPRSALPCSIAWEEMPANLAGQIKGFHSWALRFGKRESTATALLWALRALSSFALEYPCGSDITDIRQVITEEHVCHWVTSRQIKKNLPSGITTHLRRLSELVKQNDFFDQGDYGWLARRINNLMREPKWKRRERKRQLLVAPHLVAAIPLRIRAERESRKNLTPKEIAWSVHDELFISMPPWRSVNHAGVDRDLNILETKISDDLWHKVTQIPSWVHEELANNGDREFLIIHFPEDVMKGKAPIWEIMDREIEPLYRDYVENHRPLLSKHDPGALFLGRDGFALHRGGLRRLVAELTSRYLPKRISHHKRRDCTAIATILAGGSYKEVGAILHHSQRHSSNQITDEYLAGLPQVGCAEVLEQEIATLAAESNLDLS